jgi:16S rRNA (uracil1498-N3)-methyltransferase
MAIHDFNAQRLYIDADLSAGAQVPLAREQTNYLLNVLRLGAGDRILVFNGREGEWQAEVVPTGRRHCELAMIGLVRPQEGGPDIDYLFAPLKRARLDYMVQKATEMGAARLRPVITRRTIAERVNLDRMRSNVIEAAEQCGILRLPEVAEPVGLDKLLDHWKPGRRIIFCDEGADNEGPIATLSAVEPGPLAVLIGPEGGFDEAERARLIGMAETVRVSLGPRIMRADTAAVAALALVQAVLGDWRGGL